MDATLGAGGHAQGILCACAPNGELLGFDIDPKALSIARWNLQHFGSRVHFASGSYTQIKHELRKIQWRQVDGIIADFGVSSMQLDMAEKGFSFLREGPLDMRFDPNQPTTARDLVNGLSEGELSDLIFEYGEERQSRKIAHAIVKARPLNTTTDLSGAILKVIDGKSNRVHPATKTFQALRIAVNGELTAIREFLPLAVSCLRQGGRLAVICFHSLEDRIVKRFFHREASDCVCPSEQPICTCDHKASIHEVTRHPIRAAEVEVESNPRARSARLRVVEKI